MSAVRQGSASTQPPADRLIPLPEVEGMTSLRRSALFNRIRAGKFPAPTRLSQRCNRWSLQAVQQWVADQTAKTA